MTHLFRVLRSKEGDKHESVPNKRKTVERICY